MIVFSSISHFLFFIAEFLMDKIAIYYRVSTDKQDLKSQKHEIDKWYESLNKKPKKVIKFEDEGISGRTVRRPALQSMLKTAYKGSIDTIVVSRLDRFSRNASTAIRMILDLDEVGVAFISVTQPVLNLGHSNPFRRTMLAAFAEIAEIERETITARVKAGLLAAKKRGVKLGPPKKLTETKINKVIKLRESGMTIRQVCKETGLSLGSVSKIINHKLKTDTNKK